MKLFKIEKTSKRRIIHFFGIKLKFKRKSYKMQKLREMIAEEVEKSVEYRIISSNIIKDAHSKIFPKYKNMYMGKDVVLLATGPSMKYYKPMDAIHIGVNKSFLREDIKLDYIFSQDYRTIKPYLNEIFDYPCTKFFGTWLRINTIEGTIPWKYLQREDVNCYFIEPPVNDYFANNMALIEYKGLMKFGSVVYSAIQFALYTNPKRIFLVGCDCTNTGYFNGAPQISYLNENVIYEGWSKIKNFQQRHYPDTEIISINPVGLKGLFKDVYTEEYIYIYKDCDSSSEVSEKKVDKAQQLEEKI